MKAYSDYKVRFVSEQNYYCSNFDAIKNSLILYSENGTKIDTLQVVPVDSSGNYMMFAVYYPPQSLYKQGNHYDTILYRGLYGNLPESWNATLVYNKELDGVLTKIYKVD